MFPASELERIKNAIEALGKDQEDKQKSSGQGAPLFAGEAMQKGGKGRRSDKGPRRKGHPERKENTDNTKQKKEKCGRCGKSCPAVQGQPKEKCYAFNKECLKCGKKGHFEIVCRTNKAAAFSKKNETAGDSKDEAPPAALSLALVSRSEPNFLVADTGCNQTLLPMTMEKYVQYSNKKGGSVVIELAAAGQDLTAGPQQTVLLPVYDVNGKMRWMKEEGVFSQAARYPLLACAKRPTSLLMPNHPPVLQTEDEKGNKFWVPVEQHKGFPSVMLADRLPVRGCALGKKALTVNAKRIWTLEEVKKGGISKDEKQELLVALHRRLAHATGRRLYLTLEEKGWGGIYTARECADVECDACRVVNRRGAKVPRVQDTLRQDLVVGLRGRAGLPGPHRQDAKRNRWA